MQTSSSHNNKNIFKGTAKKTKTNSLWNVLNYAMSNSLIFVSLIFDSVSRFRICFRDSVFVSGFWIPCFSAASKIQFIRVSIKECVSYPCIEHG